MKIMIALSALLVAAFAIILISEGLDDDHPADMRFHR